MKAGRYDFVITPGVRLDKTFTWKRANGDLVDLTGYSARMRGRTQAEPAETVLSLSSETGEIELGGPAGTIHVRCTASQTAAMNWKGTAVYGLDLIPPAGADYADRLLEGNLRLRPRVMA